MPSRNQSKITVDNIIKNMLTAGFKEETATLPLAALGYTMCFLR
jgi:hypothetical protein